jgi:glucosamine--fructose-6-phosphate aminotransferase (isomerizing)
MLKEILEQPEACERTLKGRLDLQFSTSHLGGLNLTARDLLDIKRIKILGCGSAFYSGIGGAHLIEALTRVPADAEAASEFRYRNPVIRKDCHIHRCQSVGRDRLPPPCTGAAAQRRPRARHRQRGRQQHRAHLRWRHHACRAGVGGVDQDLHLHAGVVRCWRCISRIRDLSPAADRRLIDALQKLPDQMRASRPDQCAPWRAGTHSAPTRSSSGRQRLSG